MVCNTIFRQSELSDEQKDKIRGCFIGGAAGDALGYAVEFLDEKSIFEKYGEGGIQEYRLLYGAARISDDTQMTLFTAEGLVHYLESEGDGHPRHFVARSYLDWLKTQEEKYAPDGNSFLLSIQGLYRRRAPGNTCLGALYANRDNIYKPDYIVAHPNDSHGCGGVMRAAPVGMLGGTSLGLLERESAQIAAITHGSPLGYIPAAMLTHIVHELIFTEKDLESIVRQSVSSMKKIFRALRGNELRRMEEITSLAVALSKNDGPDIENIHKLGEGWVGEEALAIAVYCSLRYRRDFSAGIIAAANHNGDSDSTGAITGNILGALVGYGALDEKWKKNLELHDEILKMAELICRNGD